MTKNEQLFEKIIVTFFEAILSYISVNQTNLSGNTKVVAIGAVGFGLSAVYNVLRQSTPTILVPTYPQPPVTPSTSPTNISGAVPAPSPDSGVMNGVPQLTGGGLAADSEDAILDNLANEPEPPTV